MHLYVELWKARPAWLAMEQEQRTAFVARLEPAMTRLAGDAIQLVGFAVTDADVPNGADYPYMAVWQMATLEDVRVYERGVAASGWHDYFEQVNARGALQTPASVLEHMTRAQQP